MKLQRSLLFIVITILSLTSCSKQILTSLHQDIKQEHGYYVGYLDMDKIPNSLKIVPPPPAEGSIAFKHDQEIAAKSVASKDEARKKLAASDADLSFPAAVESFNRVLNVKISEENTPNLYMMLRRSLVDAGLSTYTAKTNYQRKRPFMVNNTSTCTPDDEEKLRTDGSYPSGHTAVGWAYALILSEVFPNQADAIINRGKEFGISRIVCNVHWYSDIIAGRMMGAATVAKLHSNPTFLADMEAAKKEISNLTR